MFRNETLSLGDACTNSVRSATYSGLNTLLQPLDAGTPSHAGQKVCSLQATVPYESYIYLGDVIHALTRRQKAVFVVHRQPDVAFTAYVALKNDQLTTCNCISLFLHYVLQVKSLWNRYNKSPFVSDRACG